MELVGVGSDGVVVEDDVLHALGLRRKRYDSGSIRPDFETLRCEADAESSLRTTQIIRVPQVAEAEFVDCRSTQRSRVAQVQELRSTQIQGVEARHIRSALSCGIWIVLRKVVEEIVGRE